MQHIREPNPWEYVEVLDDATILHHLKDHDARILPAARRRLCEASKDFRCIISPGESRISSEAGRNLRAASKDFRRAGQMRSRLETIALERGLIK